MLTRHKYDTRKHSFIVASKEEFDSIEVTDEMYPHLRILPLVDKQLHKKHSFFIPEIQLLPRTLPPKKNAKMSPNYIRLLPQFLLPDAKTYELTQQDLFFIQNNREHFRQNQVDYLNNEFMQQALIFMESRTKRVGNQSSQRYWLQDFELNKEINVNPVKRKELEARIFDYWCLKRRQYCYPLYRLIWTRAQNVSYLYQAYKPARKKRYPVLRDRKKIDKILMTELVEEFQAVEDICKKIKDRESIKLKQTVLMLQDFAAQASIFMDASNFQAEFSLFELSEQHLGNLTSSDIVQEGSQSQTRTLPIIGENQHSSELFTCKVQQHEPKIVNETMQKGNKTSEVDYILINSDSNEENANFEPKVTEVDKNFDILTHESKKQLSNDRYPRKTRTSVKAKSSNKDKSIKRKLMNYHNRKGKSKEKN